MFDSFSVNVAYVGLRWFNWAVFETFKVVAIFVAS